MLSKRVKFAVCFWMMLYAGNVMGKIPAVQSTMATNALFDLRVTATEYIWSGCVDTDLSIRVKVFNQSDTVVSSLPLASVIGQDTVYERFTVNLNAGDSADLTLARKVNQLTEGTYLVRVLIDTTDNNQGNNYTTVQYNLSDAPDPSFSVPDVCVGETSSFTNLTDISGFDSVRFMWYFGDGDSSTGFHVTHSYTLFHPHQTESFWVRLFARVNGCEKEKSGVITVNAPADPFFTFQLYGRKLVIDYMATANPSCNYLWDFGDGSKSNDIMPKHTYALEDIDTSVKICLTIINDAGCISSTCKYVFEPWGAVDPVKTGSALNLSPNPASVSFSIDDALQLYQNRDVQVTIVTANGRTIKTFEGSHADYDVGDLEPGIYFVMVSSGNRVIRAPLVIAR